MLTNCQKCWNQVMIISGIILTTMTKETRSYLLESNTTKITPPFSLTPERFTVHI